MFETVSMADSSLARVLLANIYELFVNNCVRIQLKDGGIHLNYRKLASRVIFFFFPWWKIPPNRVENESYSRKTVTCEILVFYFQMDSHPEGINIFESKILEIYHRKLFFINVLHLELLLGLIFYNYQKCFDSQLLKYAINWKKIEKSRRMSGHPRFNLNTNLRWS